MSERIMEHHAVVSSLQSRVRAHVEVIDNMKGIQESMQNWINYYRNRPWYERLLRLIIGEA